jgi:multiple sugar transport system ATP-binding protein
MAQLATYRQQAEGTVKAIETSSNTTLSQAQQQNEQLTAQVNQANATIKQKDEQIAALQRRLGVTTVYVTHDQVEAMTMGDRVAVLKDGILQQCASPREMYDHPNNVFVAGFIGSPAMNLLDVPVVDGGVKFGNTALPIPRDHLAEAGSRAIVGARPEDLTLSDDGTGLAVTVDVVEELGADAYIYGTSKTESGEDAQIIARVDGRTPPEKGAQIHLTPKPAHLHLFNAGSGERISV